ncbi:hypothetical protein BDY24DRAFT_187986 [Mrakia frigida]|uniref:uncharacterized protein n=1 Tax=Mrakia frigida TaxID=29902 RepID=UPI003FCC01CB
MSISPLHFFPPPLVSSSASSSSSPSISTSTSAEEEEKAYQALELNFHQRRLPSHQYQYESWVKQKGLYEDLRCEYLGILESSPWWSAKVHQLESVMEAVREGIKLAAKDARRYEKRMNSRKAAGLPVDEPTSCACEKPLHTGTAPPPPTSTETQTPKDP